MLPAQLTKITKKSFLRLKVLGRYLKTYPGKIRKSIGFDCKERDFNASVANLHQ
jgi:hypothetical protein